MANFNIFLTIAILTFTASGTAIAILSPRLYCNDVYGNFTTCLPYILEDSCSFPEKCCDAVNNLNFVAKNETGGWRRICLCIENLYEHGVHPFSDNRTHLLPQICNTSLAFPISESMDCNAAGAPNQP